MRQNPPRYSIFSQIMILKKDYDKAMEFILLNANAANAAFDWCFFAITGCSALSGCSASTRLPRGLLSASTLIAGFWAAAGLFALSFFVIHLFRWAIAYYMQKRKAARKTTAPPPPKQEQRAVEKPPEKIYYIVERKKKRESSGYAEPKEFRFK